MDYDLDDVPHGHAQRPPRASPAPIPPAEAALVRRVQIAVGGPAALSALAGPAAVRAAVIVALSEAQPNPKEKQRVAAGELTPAERRVVRTVTNRGAAVRSRLRQRKELARLRAELRVKDERVRFLEAALRDAVAAGLYPPGGANTHSTGAAAATSVGTSCAPRTAPPFVAPPPIPTTSTSTHTPRMHRTSGTMNVTLSPVSEASHPPMAPPPPAPLPMPSYSTYYQQQQHEQHNVHALHQSAPQAPQASQPQLPQPAPVLDDLHILDHLISPC